MLNEHDFKEKVLEFTGKSLVGLQIEFAQQWILAHSSPAVPTSDEYAAAFARAKWFTDALREFLEKQA